MNDKMKRNIKIVTASIILIFGYCLIASKFTGEELPLLFTTLFIMLQICVVSLFKE